ncbi:MAG TPA: hypothetical protein VGN76_03945 [Gemmatimonadales bacterium]|nr:hypothetical protein [Gemmatimonadales bacterium]
MNRLAENLAKALGCPVELTYLPDTQEVVAVAHPEPGREVRVTVPASPIWLRPLTNPFFGLKYDLLKRLRHQIKQVRHQAGQEPGDG